MSTGSARKGRSLRSAEDSRSSDILAYKGCRGSGRSRARVAGTRASGPAQHSTHAPSLVSSAARVIEAPRGTGWGPEWRQGLGAARTRCHLPIACVAYPAFLSSLASVVSLVGRPPAASELKTPPCQEAPVQPLRTGMRPVSIAAREGEQMWNAEYHCARRRPPPASRPAP